MNNLTAQQLQFYTEKGIDYLLQWIKDLSVVSDLSLQEHAVSLLARIIPVSPTDNLNFLCAFCLLYTHAKLPDFNTNSLEIFNAMVPEFQEKLEHFQELHGMLLQHAKIISDLTASTTIFEEIKEKTQDILNSPNDRELICNLLEVIFLHHSVFDQFSSQQKAIACLQTLVYLNCTDADLTHKLNEHPQSPCFQLLLSICEETQIIEELDEQLEQIEPTLNNENNYFIEDNIHLENFLKKEEISSESIDIHNNSIILHSSTQQEILIDECQTPEKSHGLMQKHMVDSFLNFKIISRETDNFNDIQQTSTLSTANSEEVLCKLQHHGKISSSALTPFSLADTLF